MVESNTQNQKQDGRADFDFIIGRWNIHHWRLREWLNNSTSWEEFEGTSRDYKILSGLGSISEVTLHRASGHMEGITVRLFDPASGQWSIYWADSVNGTLTTPMIGGFTRERGEFYAQEPFKGKHIYSRFIWSNITATSFRWEQAFSADGGRTWETNWIMEVTRSQE